MKKTGLGLAVGLAAMLASGPVFAEQAPGAADDPNAPKLLTEWGMSISVGLGVGGFVDEDMRDFVEVAGAWDARVVLGTRTNFAIEAAYTGGAAEIDALGLDKDAALISSGAEANLRYNMRTGALQPYAVAGVGVRHYELVNADTNTSNVTDSDNVIEMPIGIGMSYRYRGFVSDIRGTFRPAFSENLIETTGNQSSTKLHNWGMNLTAGWEF